jgi:preprotein translocase subunit SecB
LPYPRQEKKMTLVPHNTSPLAILNHRFLLFECRATPGEQTGGALELKTFQEFSAAPDNPLHWKVILTIEFCPENPAVPSTYEGKISVEGEFQIHEGFEEQNCEALIRVTATSILYGACREMIASFSARSIHGILSLPSISFRQTKEVVKKISTV